MYHMWDFDLTLGNCGYFPGAVGNGPDGFWVNELLPELKKIPEFIDEQAFIIEPARERNFKVWNINESVFWVNFPSLGSYEAELDYLKEFYTDRLQWLTTGLNKL